MPTVGRLRMQLAERCGAKAIDAIHSAQPITGPVKQLISRPPPGAAAVLKAKQVLAIDYHQGYSGLYNTTPMRLWSAGSN